MTDSNSNSNDKVYLGGLWDSQAKSGVSYITGSFGIGGKILIYANQYKTQESDPDYKMYLAPRPQKDEAAKKSNNDFIPF